MRSISVLRLAILGEGLLVLIALVWAWWREISFVFGGATEGVVIGSIAAGGLGAANYYLLCGAPDMAGVRSIRQLFVEGLKPIFGNLSPIRDHRHQSGRRDWRRVALPRCSAGRNGSCSGQRDLRASPHGR